MSTRAVVILSLLFPTQTLLLGCSSSDGGTATDGGPADGAHPLGDDGAVADPDASPVADAGEETPGDAPSAEVTAHDPTHECPGCQAGKCATELKACAGDSKCVDWLMCMNDCWKKADGQSTCLDHCLAAHPSAAATKFDACDRTQCAAECAPLS